MAPRNLRRRQRAAAIHVTRCYAPDLARQAQALLRLLTAREVSTDRGTTHSVEQAPKDVSAPGHEE